MAARPVDNKKLLDDFNRTRQMMMKNSRYVSDVCNGQFLAVLGRSWAPLECKLSLSSAPVRPESFVER